jgi:membrane protease YdiL (CAAX protease family)
MGCGAASSEIGRRTGRLNLESEWQVLGTRQFGYTQRSSSLNATFVTADAVGYALSNQLDATTEESKLNARRRTTYLWIEIGVVLLVYVVPVIFISEADIYGLRGKLRPTPFVYHALLSLIENTGYIALVLFIIWRSNDSPSRFGFQQLRIGRDLFGGIAICAVLRGMYHLIWWGLRSSLSHNEYFSLTHSGVGVGYNSPSGTPEFVLLGAMCLASGFVQELVMRAYLIARFEELFESTPVALLLSTVLFTCYHGYQDTGSVIGVVVFGVILGVLFCLFRRLAPLAIAHALNNFLSIGNVRWL